MLGVFWFANKDTICQAHSGAKQHLIECKSTDVTPYSNQENHTFVRVIYALLT